MARTPQTAPANQIKTGLKLGALALAMIVILGLCLRGPVRRLFLHHPRFEPAPLMVLPHPIATLALGDVSGDGRSDLIIASADGMPSRIAVFPSRDGGFDLEHPIDLPEPIGALDLVCADLDADGQPDVLASGRSDQARAVVVWRNEGGLQFERTIAPAPLRLFDVIDVDRDGQPELVGLTRNFGEINIHTVTGGEVNSDPEVSDWLNDTSIRDLAAAHLDRGGVDIALLSFVRQGGRVRLLRSGGLIPDLTSYFNLPPIVFAGQRVSSTPPSLVFEDLNGDERPDLAFIDAEGVRLLLNISGGDFAEARHPVPTPPVSRLVAGDVDGDGHADLVAVGPDHRTLHTLWGRP